jgi:hypothetical protein
MENKSVKAVIFGSWPHPGFEIAVTPFGLGVLKFWLRRGDRSNNSLCRSCLETLSLLHTFNTEQPTTRPRLLLFSRYTFLDH